MAKMIFFFFSFELVFFATGKPDPPTPLFFSHSPSHSPSSSPETICSNFFTVLSEIQPFHTVGLEPCADTFVRMDYFFRSLSSQMSDMNTTLYIFTTYSPTSIHCKISYPNLQLIYFDIFEIFSEFQLQDIIPIFENVYYDDYAKISDILRILIARKYSMTYIDLDIHFLNQNPVTYQQEFVSMHIWNQNQCSLEITNAAFCLSSKYLILLQDAMIHQIKSGNIYKYHTELGPTLFAKVLTNSPDPIFFYSLNHPEIFHLPDMIEEIRRYQHNLLHLTSSLRQLLSDSQTMSYDEYIDTLRSQLNLPSLQLSPSVLNSESFYYALQAMITNHPTYPNQLSLCLQLAEMSVTRHLSQCQEERYREEIVEESYYETVEILNKVMTMTTADPESSSSELFTYYQLTRELIKKLDQETCTSLGQEGDDEE